jgi:hypothetical protein
MLKQKLHKPTHSKKSVSTFQHGPFLKWTDSKGNGLFHGRSGRISFSEVRKEVRMASNGFFNKNATLKNFLPDFSVGSVLAFFN